MTGVTQDIADARNAAHAEAEFYAKPHDPWCKRKFGEFCRCGARVVPSASGRAYDGNYADAPRAQPQPTITTDPQPDKPAGRWVQFAVWVEG